LGFVQVLIKKNPKPELATQVFGFWTGIYEEKPETRAGARFLGFRQDFIKKNPKPGLAGQYTLHLAAGWLAIGTQGVATTCPGGGTWRDPWGGAESNLQVALPQEALQKPACCKLHSN